MLRGLNKLKKRKHKHRSGSDERVVKWQFKMCAEQNSSVAKNVNSKGKCLMCADEEAKRKAEAEKGKEKWWKGKKEGGKDGDGDGQGQGGPGEAWLASRGQLLM